MTPEERAALPRRMPSPIECGHTNRKHWAHGMCKSCYNTAWVKADPARRQARNEYEALWATRHPEETKIIKRRSLLRKSYGLEWEDYQKLLDFQDRTCAICLVKFTDEGVIEHLDHDHATGEVRGVLCDACNHGLGRFRDSIEYLERAQQYLRRPPYQGVKQSGF